MSEEIIVRHCSPTMAGLKTGSLFNCPAENKEILTREIRRLNKSLVPNGLRLVPLKFMEWSALIYMYRPQRLEEDLGNTTAARILLEKEYPVGQTEKCVVRLRHSLNSSAEFPHEIGLFLGYPPEDVEGFMKNGAAGAKYTGAWKVYGDVQTAQRKFEQYKKCTRLYCEAFLRHRSFDRLIVSCS